MPSIVSLGESMSDTKRKKLMIGIKIFVAASIVCVILIVMAGMLWQRNHGKVYLYFSEVPMIIGKEVTVDVKVSDLPEIYPAASFVIDFDSDQLEFVEIKQGNVKIECKDGSSFTPEWQFQKEIANANGQVSTMYLDMTAGDKPFSRKGFEKGKHDVLFRLTFLVKYSCGVGDKIKLSMSQATFAAVEGEGSEALSLHQGNLSVRSKEYQVGQE